MKKLTALATAIAVIAALSAISYAQTTAITYQGRLNDNSVAANGNYQMQFSLYDAISGGTQVGATVENANVSVTNGIFTTQLDFGANAFDGGERFIEIAVRRNSSESYVTLDPRQPITSAPYATRARFATTAEVANTALNAERLGGFDSSEFVRGNVVRSFNGRTGDTGIAPGNNVSLTVSSSSNFVRLDVTAVNRITTRYSNQFTISGNSIQKFIMTCSGSTETPIGGGYVMLNAIGSSGAFALRFVLLQSGPAFEDPSQWVTFIQNTTGSTGVGYYYITCARSN